jgi:2-keto-4-pentenoate hydratase/2-oxohepta-3-ene-1,7-dioic acid hydratase in catechol pathway
MKLITFATPSHVEHIGALLEDGTTLVDFTASDSAPYFRDMLALIDGGAPSLDHARALVGKPRETTSLSQVKLRSPVPEPRQMRDFLSFEKHVRQARANRHLLGVEGQTRDPAKVEIPPVWYKQPVYYKCSRFGVVGHGEDVIWPRYANVMDYELEFGIFLGKNGKNVGAGEARSYIFGYTIFNDFTARDALMAEVQGMLGPGKGKDFDTGNSIGPWLVTADEIPDPYNLTMIARVNGEEWSRGTSADMRHKLEDFIAHISIDEKIRAGEFLGSGTVGGGCGMELGRFLKPGDEVELEITGLGTLRNRLMRS